MTTSGFPRPLETATASEAPVAGKEDLCSSPGPSGGDLSTGKGKPPGASRLLPLNGRFPSCAACPLGEPEVIRGATLEQTPHRLG